MDFKVGDDVSLNPDYRHIINDSTKKSFCPYPFPGNIGTPLKVTRVSPSSSRVTLQRPGPGGAPFVCSTLVLQSVNDRGIPQRPVAGSFVTPTTDWVWGDQNRGGWGTVVGFKPTDGTNKCGWVEVCWINQGMNAFRHKNFYRWGIKDEGDANGKYDVETRDIKDARAFVDMHMMPGAIVCSKEVDPKFAMGPHERGVITKRSGGECSISKVDIFPGTFTTNCSQLQPVIPFRGKFVPLFLVNGMRVRRSLDWKWDNQDGSQNGGSFHTPMGTVKTTQATSFNAWTAVSWTTTREHEYRYSIQNGIMDVEPVWGDSDALVHHIAQGVRHLTPSPSSVVRTQHGYHVFSEREWKRLITTSFPAQKYPLTGGEGYRVSYSHHSDNCEDDDDERSGNEHPSDEENNNGLSEEESSDGGGGDVARTEADGDDDANPETIVPGGRAAESPTPAVDWTSVGSLESRQAFPLYDASLPDSVLNAVCTANTTLSCEPSMRFDDVWVPQIRQLIEHATHHSATNDTTHHSATNNTTHHSATNNTTPDIAALRRKLGLAYNHYENTASHIETQKDHAFERLKTAEARHKAWGTELSDVRTTTTMKASITGSDHQQDGAEMFYDDDDEELIKNVLESFGVEPQSIEHIASVIMSVDHHHTAAGDWKDIHKLSHRLSLGGGLREAFICRFVILLKLSNMLDHVHKLLMKPPLDITNEHVYLQSTKGTTAVPLWNMTTQQIKNALKTTHVGSSSDDDITTDVIDAYGLNGAALCGLWEGDYHLLSHGGGDPTTVMEKLFETLSHVDGFQIRNASKLLTIVKSDVGIPDIFLCPITRKLMRDPCLGHDQRFYNFPDLCEWYRTCGNSKTSPVDRVTIKNGAIFKIQKCQSLKSAIDDFVKGVFGGWHMIETDM
jgi:hypothetical protein